MKLKNKIEIDGITKTKVVIGENYYIFRSDFEDYGHHTYELFKRKDSYGHEIYPNAKSFAFGYAWHYPDYFEAENKLRSIDTVCHVFEDEIL